MTSLSNKKTIQHLTIAPTTNLVVGATYVCSPNYDLRPDNTEIDLLVLHGISLPPGEFIAKSEQYLNNLFTNTLDPEEHPYFQEIYQLKVSCHCLIKRDGKLIQYVPFNYRAWHAGISYFNGKNNCNDFSIGIELEGSENLAYTKAQYKILLPLINLIRKTYPKITKDHIVGHCDIAPDRKTDPGSLFDWGWVAKNFE